MKKKVLVILLCLVGALIAAGTVFAVYTSLSDGDSSAQEKEDDDVWTDNY